MSEVESGGVRMTQTTPGGAENRLKVTPADCRR